jgi:PKHD-type hydroxylase
MKYAGLTHGTRERAQITEPWCWISVFDAEQLARVCDYCSHLPMTPGTTGGGSVSADIRVSKINFFKPNTDNEWIFRRCNEVIEHANGRWWGFDLNGYDMIQYTEYTAGEHGRYDWHMDTFLGCNLPSEMHEPRKLSVSILLNDGFDGGEFQINVGDHRNPHRVMLKPGQAVFFPSWLIHRVTPVFEGIRKSLVIWVTGPKFT